MMVKRANFPSSMCAYLQTPTMNPGRIPTLQDLPDHTKADPDEDSSNHKVESFELAVSLDLDSQEFKYLEATRDFNRGEGGLHDAIDRSELGILVIPTCCNVSASFASLEGSPITSIPLEFYRPAEL